MTNIYDELKQEILPVGTYISNDGQYKVNIVKYSQDLGTVLYNIYDIKEQQYVHDGHMVIEHTPVAMNILEDYISENYGEFSGEVVEIEDLLFEEINALADKNDELEKQIKDINKRLKKLEDREKK